MNVLWTIIGCGIVTWLSRVIPFVLVKNFDLPKWLIQYLSFVPLVIMTALIMENIFTHHAGSLPTVNYENLLATVPTFVAAIISKSLIVIVVVGIVSMALIRLAF
ncbi:AzlD domain-containing protein [Pediococcus inopinatus]|uniref:AzlD domain-containing protein n=2 Tax=Lactobacillaceae TaxID=33958 RepID=A0ABZ0Q5T7_9LACO|nr:AzlD domain-containing protein [Pediococcus inopinatus]WPC16713.1 AzlD domain-containing protein [Pediococcus inopinatus]WPC20161.1 AzlD domain-containing protein [Pediococcus inopinatus]WPC21867.1 AzlD domain-containing protein [Pediococcus inopinatus]WPP09204.1 AzlD domain-containing protein [Pediococcus inopinatus]